MSILTLLVLKMSHKFDFDEWFLGVLIGLREADREKVKVWLRTNGFDIRDSLVSMELSDLDETDWKMGVKRALQTAIKSLKGQLSCAFYFNKFL
jgi:hypothetical protein